jgi:hypothetical protein
MNDQPRIMRPHFPQGYVQNPKALLPWSHVEERLSAAKNYWLCTTRPNGRPHVIPKWGVWVDGKIYFDGSPATRHAKNLRQNPYVAVHLESGDNVLIVNGVAQASPKPTRELGKRLAQAYAEKYKALGYAPTPDQWDNGGLFEVAPHTVLAWTSFTDDPTKFVLESK